MKLILNPLFANTCGKIFHDRIELASQCGDSVMYRSELAGAEVKSSLVPTEIVLACMPLILPGLSFFLTPEETGLKMLFILLGMGATMLMLYKGKRKHTLVIRFTNGKTRYSNIHPENITDARKFVKEVKKMMLNSKQKGPEKHISGAVNHITAKI